MIKIIILKINKEIERMNKKRIVLSIAATLCTSMLNAESFDTLFKEGKLSGEIRSMYMEYNEKNAPDNYATAAGGMLEYALGDFRGISGGVKFVTTNDIASLSGEGVKRNSELSGEKKSYNQLSEAYLSYSYRGVALKAGRQSFDTPLADTDDIRMIPNSFEAYTLGFEKESFSLFLGNIQKWQGVDAGLENRWVKTGEDGTNFIGCGYANDMLEANIWFYNFTKTSLADQQNGAENIANNSYYGDVSSQFELFKDFKIGVGAQYLKQEESDKSGVKSEIYGVKADAELWGFGVEVSYNDAKREAAKHSFSGYGGGTLYTNMDAMILDEITEDARAYAWVGALSYEYKGVNLSYAYGDFKTDRDANYQKAHIVEQDFSVEYSYNKALRVSAIYVIDRNKEDSRSEDFNNDNFRVLLAYNF